MSLMNLLVAARNGIAAWRRRGRAYAELMALDERSLADIGIRRSDIPALLDGSFLGDSSRQLPPAAKPVGFTRPHIA